MSYAQLSASERNRLYELRTTTSLSMRAIGRELGRDASTISRELARNRSERGYYLPDHAQQAMQTRRQQSKTAFSHVSEICIFEIKTRLKQGQFKVEVQHLLKSACSHGSKTKPMKETYSLLCCAVPCSWLWS